MDLYETTYESLTYSNILAMYACILVLDGQINIFVIVQAPRITL